MKLREDGKMGNPKTVKVVVCGNCRKTRAMFQTWKGMKCPNCKYVNSNSQYLNVRARNSLKSPPFDLAKFRAEQVIRRAGRTDNTTSTNTAKSVRSATES